MFSVSISSFMLLFFLFISFQILHLKFILFQTDLDFHLFIYLFTNFFLYKVLFYQTISSRHLNPHSTTTVTFFWILHIKTEYPLLPLTSPILFFHSLLLFFPCWHGLDETCWGSILQAVIQSGSPFHIFIARFYYGSTTEMFKVSINTSTTHGRVLLFFYEF